MKLGVGELRARDSRPGSGSCAAAPAGCGWSPGTGSSALRFRNSCKHQLQDQDHPSTSLPKTTETSDYCSNIKSIVYCAQYPGFRQMKVYHEASYEERSQTMFISRAPQILHLVSVPDVLLMC